MTLAAEPQCGLTTAPPHHNVHNTLSTDLSQDVYTSLTDHWPQPIPLSPHIYTHSPPGPSGGTRTFGELSEPSANCKGGGMGGVENFIVEAGWRRWGVSDPTPPSAAFSQSVQGKRRQRGTVALAERDYTILL